MMTDLLLIVAAQRSQERIREELGETRCRCEALEVIGSAQTPHFMFWQRFFQSRQSHHVVPSRRRRVGEG
jgi:hypothetical protein